MRQNSTDGGSQRTPVEDTAGRTLKTGRRVKEHPKKVCLCVCVLVRVGGAHFVLSCFLHDKCPWFFRDKKINK